MFEKLLSLFKKKPILYRLENEKTQMCYKITYNMNRRNGGVSSTTREFVLPDNIIDDMNNGWDLESIEIRDYHFKVISINPQLGNNKEE